MVGTYVLRDDLHLATPPPHPSEAPITNPNPLATTPAPATCGVKLSLAVLGPRKSSPQLYKLNTSTSIRSNLQTYSIKESERETRTSGDDGSDVGGQQHVNGNLSNRTPAFGEGNPFSDCGQGQLETPKTQEQHCQEQLLVRFTCDSS
jgi:hypothetical protein